MFQIDLTSYQNMSSVFWIAILVVSGAFFKLFVMFRRTITDDDKRKSEQLAQEKMMQLILDQFRAEQEERRQQQRSMEIRISKMGEQNIQQQRELTKLHGDSRACAAENAVLRADVGHLRQENSALRDELAKTNSRVTAVASGATPAPMGV